MADGWFEVDKKGLSQLLERRGKGFVPLELIQNAWDQNVNKVDLRFEKIPGRPFAKIEVEDDDPDGFSDLSHAFTLFARTSKRDNPEQRGRFNIGEKLVLAICKEATISTTKGTVRFDDEGRHTLRQKRDSGSIFSGIVRMNQNEFDEAVKLINCLLPPTGICTTFNGEVLPTRCPIEAVEESLPTEIADAEGNLRPTKRKTVVNFYETNGQPAMIYEMGIPVVETGDDYHVNVMQKVPLNIDRDNVTPAFLKLTRVLMLNVLHDRIDEEQANSDWVRSASSDNRCTSDAMTAVLDQRFSKKRVAYDPSDPEANNKAASLGYTVVHGPQMNKQEWKNAKEAEAILPAGKVTPAKPVFNGTVPAMNWDDLTSNMQRVSEYAVALAARLMNVDLEVSFLDCEEGSIAATYARSGLNSGQLTFYVKRLGKNWFLTKNAANIDRLIIHEFGHKFSSDHLSHEYHAGLCRLGVAMKELAISDPSFFKLSDPDLFND